MTTSGLTDIAALETLARHRARRNAPAIVSRRYLFRPFVASDIRKLANVPCEHHKVDSTADVYRPEVAQDARSWLGSPPADCIPLDWTVFAKDHDRVIGYAGLSNIDTARRQTQLRFWIGCGVVRPDRGDLACASECVEALVEFGFRQLALHRIYALQLARLPRPGDILSSIEMTVDGYLRKRVHDHGLFEDIACWAITADTWATRRRQ